MLQVRQTADVTITGYTSEGEGVCRVDGCAVFVPNALRGDTCRISVTHVGKTRAHGKIELLLTRSPHRVSRDCPYAKRCGGCQLWHMDYAEELRFKAQKVLDALNRIGGQELTDLRITGGDGRSFDLSALAAEDGTAEAPRAIDWAYRNKAQYPVQTRNGRAAAGFYQQKTHNVVPIDRCLIQDPAADRAKAIVQDWAGQFQIPAYDEAEHRGLLRHVFVRRGFDTGQVMVCLVINGEELPRKEELIRRLRRGVPGLASVMLSVNRARTNVVLGVRFQTLWGADEIEDRLCGFTFRLSPRSFYQVNHDQAQRLYQRAIDFAALTGEETVLDLYCGTGTITLALSRHAGQAVGVEIIPQAIADAKENARRNGVDNVAFFCADAGEAARRFAAALPSPLPEKEKSLPAGERAAAQRTDAGNPLPPPQAPSARLTAAEQSLPRGETDPARPEGVPALSSGPDCIVVDPPRKGLSPDVIDAIGQMAPKRVVYISCDPATLARDVKLLTQIGYTLTRAEAFDLFPRTFHIETVVLLSKGEVDSKKIRVEFSLEDMDMSEFQDGATYPQIKEYVLEHTGLKVSSLYISQIKRKCGLEVGKNYNLPKSEDSRQPQCPPEKEKAIREAFKYFGMI